MTTAQADTLSPIAVRPERCAIVLDQALAPGHAANAAAILALTLGARLPELPGAPLTAGDATVLPGLYPAGLPVLRATAAQLAELVDRVALGGDEIGMVVMPAAAQTTTDYESFRAAVAQTPVGELAPAGVLVAGPGRAVRRLTGSFGLLR